MKRVIFKDNILLLISIIVLMMGTAWIYPLEDEGIIITGKIINGTTGTAIDSLPVSLKIYTQESDPQIYETIADDEGTFIISGIDNINTGDLLIVDTIYQGVTYSSERLVYDSSQDLSTFEIKVYNTTNQPEAIRITRYSVLINRVEAQLRLGEYYLISNQSDLTWVGEQDPALGKLTTLEFMLPEGVQNLWFSGEGLGDRYFETRQGFVDTKPIPPGEKTLDVFFSYEIPFADSIVFNRAHSFPIDQINIMVSETSGITITGEGIKSEGKIDTEMGTAFAFSVNPSQANEAISFKISDSQGINEPSIAMVFILGIIILGVVLFGAYWFWWRPNQNKLPETAYPLLVKITELDREYENGHLDNRSYHKQRDAIKEEIKHLVNHSK